MNSLRFQLGLPAVFTLALILLAWMPPEVLAQLGCRNRGLWAITIGLSSGLFGIVAAFTALSQRLRGVEGSERWALSGALFAVPVALLLALM